MNGRVLHAGTADGRALVLDAPLSFWGGVDQRSGLIIDRHHPQLGQSVAGRILVMTSGRGSSSSSSVLAEALRAGTGPAAILLSEADEILVVGALVSEMVDGTQVPVLLLDPADHRRIATDDRIRIAATGEVNVQPGAT